jgi:hypothetical protein
MRVKIQAKRRPRTITGLEAPQPDYPLRGGWFFVSVAVHGLIVLALMSATFSAKPTPRPVYDEFIKPNAHKLVFYDFRKKVPEVAPVKRVGRSPDPRGVELSTQAIIASSRKPKSEQVFITVPAPKVEIRHDMPTPLLIARLETVLPAPAARPIPKTFVPPPPSKQEPKLPMQTPVLDAPVPPVSSSAVSALAAPTLTFPKLSAPARVAPEAPTAHPGNASADIAVASLHPSENLDAAVPNGDRPGRFSKAPKQGEPASGDTNATATLTVPDLTIRPPKPEPPPPPPPIPTHEVLYAERVRGIPQSTLSVPLRPSSRMIPPAVDARFQGRNVYTIVIPMERMATYTGDWIMWFADRESKPGETPVVRAPVPVRKLEPVDQPPASDRTGQRIQFAATLGKNGRLNGITVLTGANARVVHVVVDDVGSWEFQPATRDGKPVDVDVVVEVPFSIPTAAARSSQPQ